MEYMSVTEAAQKWGISRKRVQVLCAQSRIPHAQQVGKYWVIPADAVKPSDRRRKCADRIVTSPALLSEEMGEAER